MAFGSCEGISAVYCDGQIEVGKKCCFKKLINVNKKVSIRSSLSSGIRRRLLFCFAEYVWKMLKYAVDLLALSYGIFDSYLYRRTKCRVNQPFVYIELHLSKLVYLDVFCNMYSVF